MGGGYNLFSEALISAPVGYYSRTLQRTLIDLPVQRSYCLRENRN